ncbi:MAG: molybdopterin-dependent oxidoreductase [Pseudomonadota bacterium]
MTPIKTTCPYCGVGCGVEVTPAADGRWELRGDPDHPANRGRLCSKGAALADTIATDRGRLLKPVVGGTEVNWDGALDAITDAWQRIIRDHGADAVAFYASGQMLTEDYYVANKLMKGYLGTANIDTNSRLCMSSAVAGHERAFGADTVACSYSDLETTDLLILVGSNLAWCHPVLYQRVKQARRARTDMRVVVIDPRRTETCEIADLHLPVAADADISLFNGLLSLLAAADELDEDYIATRTSGFDAVLDKASPATTEALLAETCGLATKDVALLMTWLRAARTTVTAFSMGVNQSRCGTDKVNAITNLHLATGRIGKSGCGPFSITGQPNAMGGREVGGLSSTLAAHMAFSPENCARVQRFWGSPRIATAPGLKAVELFEAIERGDIRSVWIMATNPLFSLPDADRWRRALERCDCVIVSDCVDDTDTLAVADIRLPALGWGEKTGSVTNSERCISRQRAFLPAPGDARADWWAICEVAKRLGFTEGFSFDNVAAVFAEHAALSGFENNGQRDFDISALAGAAERTYLDASPVRWPLGAPEVFQDGRFFTQDQRARFVSVKAESSIPQATGRFVLNTGRVRDHWHSMTRTGRAARLCEHSVEPLLSVHPEDAAALGLDEGEFVRVSSDCGRVLLRCELSPQQRLGEVFVPMHWSGRFSGASAINRLVAAETDPVSGEPAYKCTVVSPAAEPVAWSGVYLGPATVTLETDYWVVVPAGEHQRILFASTEGSAAVAASARNALATALLPHGNRCITLHDAQAGIHRWAVLGVRNELIASLSIGVGEIDRDQGWLSSLLNQNGIVPMDESWLLAGMSPLPQSARGRLVCSCNRVWENEILEQVRAGCMTTEEITSRCQAGGGCGSCLPEVQSLIDQHQQQEAVCQAV